MVTVQNNVSRSRFDIYEDGAEVGFVQYEMRNGRMWFIFTELTPRFAAHGDSPSYLGPMLDEMHHRRMEVLPYCPIVRAFIFLHPQYIDLVPDDQLRRFGLSNDPDPSIATHPNVLPG